MTCHVGEGFVLCTGSGGWRVTLALQCTWCKEIRRGLTTPIFGGWEGWDSICGTCGSYMVGDYGHRKITQQAREENIAMVASVADPKCWDCHDTGDLSDPGNPLEEPMPRPCHCARGQEADRG